MMGILEFSTDIEPICLYMKEFYHLLHLDLTQMTSFCCTSVHVSSDVRCLLCTPAKPVGTLFSCLNYLSNDCGWVH